MTLRWVSNHDPNHPPMATLGQSPEEARRAQEQWLVGKVIGEPQAVNVKGAVPLAKLKAWGMVGVYVQGEPAP